MILVNFFILKFLPLDIMTIGPFSEAKSLKNYTLLSPSCQWQEAEKRPDTGFHAAWNTLPGKLDPYMVRIYCYYALSTVKSQMCFGIYTSFS